MARRPYAWLNPAIVAGAAVPILWLAWRGATGRLGPTPISEAMKTLGLMALILLLACLACTPLRRWAGWTWPPRARRTLGLLAFACAALHVSVYVGLDRGLRLSAILDDVVQRRFIVAGFAAFLLLVPLALTSTHASVRRLGFQRWTRLHALVYPAAILAVVHFIWRVKVDLTLPLAYAALLALLLLLRLVAPRAPSSASAE